MVDGLRAIFTGTEKEVPPPWLAACERFLPDRKRGAAKGGPSPVMQFSAIAAIAAIAAVAERVLAGIIFPVRTHAAAAAETRTAGRTATAGTVIRLCRHGRGETVRAAAGRVAATAPRIAAAAVVRAAAPGIAAAGRTAGSKQNQIDQIHICFPPRKR